jgi:hypothetical protein
MAKRRESPLLPTLKSLEALVKSVKREVARYPDDFIDPDSDDDDAVPYCELTVGASGESTSFGYQTGDNSYTGGAYGYPHWAVVTVGLDDSPREVAREIQSQIADLWYSSH